MVNSEIRKQIHQLVEEATESQLDAVLQALKPGPSPYSKNEIDSFYKRASKFQEDNSIGHSVEESHTLIRNKFKDSGI